ncbi:DUF3616 domain-containing protein [Paracoccus actinidiae]|uniref:DUF3616 domain-containing protein n=1 Tax=Paracoccus actinidiae TaxID=3064531 RepID=UPI0027D2D356|nr:DUF3616 domain-containing protein [Paracoccus sp. M09]
MVADDEDNILRIYRTLEGGAPVATFDLDASIQPTPQREADFEGATWLDGKIYLIGSHSRNGDGERRKDRRQFFSIGIAAGTVPTITLDPPVSLHSLAESLSELDTTLSDTIRLDVEEDVSLAPDNGGFNIEGLSATIDGDSIFIGLRSPQTPAGEAIVISFANPTEALAGGAPQFELFAKLDLDGRGIRSMEVVPALGTYIIVAGPGGGAAPFALYRWSGVANADPVEIPGFSIAIAGLSDFTPEAMIPSQDGTQMLVLSDDGDVCPSPPSFRGIQVEID